MQEGKNADYTLLKIDRKNRTLEEAGKIMDEKIRENDMLGVSEDGTLYLVLSQTPPEDARFAVERFNASGVGCRIVSKEEEAEL